MSQPIPSVTSTRKLCGGCCCCWSCVAAVTAVAVVLLALSLLWLFFCVRNIEHWYEFCSAIAPLRQDIPMPQTSICDTRLYDLLGTTRRASEADIKKAYHRLALLHHPDKGGDLQHFNQMTQAYQVLIDPEQKRQYDRSCRITLGTLLMRRLSTVLVGPPALFFGITLASRLQPPPDERTMEQEFINVWNCSVQVLAGDSVMWHKATKEWNRHNTPWGFFSSSYSDQAWPEQKQSWTVDGLQHHSLLIATGYFVAPTVFVVCITVLAIELLLLTAAIAWKILRIACSAEGFAVWSVIVAVWWFSEWSTAKNDADANNHRGWHAGRAGRG